MTAKVLFAGDGDVLPGSRLGTGEIKRRGEAWREKIADLLLEAVGRDEVHSDLNSAELPSPTLLPLYSILVYDSTTLLCSTA